MSYHSKTDMLKMADSIKDGIVVLQVRLGELTEAIASSSIPDPAPLRCPFCGPLPLGPTGLAEHIHVSHPEPVLAGATA